MKRPIRSIRVIRVRKTSQFSNSVILDILVFFVISCFFVIQILLRKHSKISKYTKTLFLLMTDLWSALFSNKGWYCFESSWKWTFRVILNNSNSSSARRILLCFCNLFVISCFYAIQTTLEYYYWGLALVQRIVHWNWPAIPVYILW